MSDNTKKLHGISPWGKLNHTNDKNKNKALFMQLRGYREGIKKATTEDEKELYAYLYADTCEFLVRNTDKKKLSSDEKKLLFIK